MQIRHFFAIGHFDPPKAALGPGSFAIDFFRKETFATVFALHSMEEAPLLDQINVSSFPPYLSTTDL